MTTTKDARPTLLVDGDALAYRVAAATERETEWAPGEITLSTSLGAAREGIDYHLQTWMQRHNAKGLRVAMSDSPWTFRMSVYKPYKMHRGDKRKPLGLAKIRQHLFDVHGASLQPGLEADDLMGLWMTDRYTEDGLIVSWDKDMRAVPGRFWVPGTEAIEERGELDADLMWFAQALSGDQADGYPGCRNIGVVRAQRIINEAYDDLCELHGHNGPGPEATMECLWRTVLNEFKKKGHTEEDALVSARLARILRHGDYDLKTKEVHLWTPPGDRSSSPSILTPPARVRARARKFSHTSPTKRGSRATWSRLRSRSAARLAKSSPQVGTRRRSGRT